MPADIFRQDAAIVLQCETVVIDRLPGEPQQGNKQEGDNDGQSRHQEQKHQYLLPAVVSPEGFGLRSRQGNSSGQHVCHGFWINSAQRF